MLTGIPKFVLVAGYKEGMFFSEFLIINSMSGISINTPFKLSIFNNEILPWSSINNESKTVSLSFLETKLPPKSILE